jgi:hypothetical protein
MLAHTPLKHARLTIGLSQANDFSYLTGLNGRRPPFDSTTRQQGMWVLGAKIARGDWAGLMPIRACT